MDDLVTRMREATHTISQYEPEAWSTGKLFSEAAAEITRLHTTNTAQQAEIERFVAILADGEPKITARVAHVLAEAVADQGTVLSPPEALFVTLSAFDELRTALHASRGGSDD